MTHLHFDHCGGSVQWNAEKRDEPAFKNAKFWNESHWEWATNRTLGESIFPFENILPMQESGQLNFIKRPTADFLEKKLVLYLLCRWAY
jgi:glyoxylase-like metal-dependent hydrolase (beta-lactamase superfamily II)